MGRGPSKKIKGEVEQKMIEMAAQGNTNGDIAKALDVHRVTIYRHLIKEDVSEAVERIREEVLRRCLPEACENYENWIKDKPESDTEKKIQYQATKDVMSTFGVVSGEGGAVGSGNTFLTPKIEQILNVYYQTLNVGGVEKEKLE